MRRSLCGFRRGNANQDTEKLLDYEWGLRWGGPLFSADLALFYDEYKDLRLAWQAGRNLEVPVSGENLLDAQHGESPRSGMFTLHWRWDESGQACKITQTTG